MFRIINLEQLQDILGGTGPVDGVLYATVYRGRRPAIRLDGEQAVFPATVRLTITDGEPTAPLQLDDQLPADCYYYLKLATQGRNSLVQNVVVPSGSGPVDFADLITVDPTTILPVEGSIGDQWVAALIADDTSAIHNALLAYMGDGEPLLAAHIAADEPHPAYDVDLPSLTVLFENGIV